MKYIPLLLILLCIVFFYLQKQSRVDEGFIDVEKYSNVNYNNNKLNLCTNFTNNCVGTNNHNCNDTGIVACQKYEIKCENKCRNKQLDNDEKKEPDFNKCVKTCAKVKKDCCSRLNKIS